jgi:ABC-type cobalamin/Fe3+-siderophores transport system ATPase subunit
MILMENFQIKQIQIRNLWQQGNIQWDLRGDVNVLIGNNGSGKTTIINLIYEAMKTNEIDIDFEKFNLIDSLMIQLNNAHSIQINADGRKLIGFDSLVGLQTEKINTFDNTIGTITPNKTLLDAHIEKLKEPFVRYQRNLSRKIEQLFYKQNTVSKAEREQIFAKKDLFIQFINDLFKDTHKTFNEDDFVFAKSGQTSTIEPCNLSSGEKQVFLILLTVLLQDGKPCILFLDEPVISLHIEWQRILIKMIRDLNENCQVIVTTHSPSLYFKGWSDRMKRISDIMFVNC